MKPFYQTHSICIKCTQKKKNSLWKLVLNFGFCKCSQIILQIAQLQVLEFKKGTLQNLYWKRDKCSSCSGKSNFVCINKQYCGIKLSSCKNKGGTVDCSLGIQLAFSGTDKHLSALNSWYEVEKLRQYSLYGLYSNLRNSLTDQYNKFF